MVQKFAKALKDLNDVVAPSYGYELEEDYGTKSKKFSCTCLDLWINVTPKVHAVMDYVLGFCALTGRELGRWSEQAKQTSQTDLARF